MKILTRTIWILSLISLFGDIASEMLYPVMPVYLRSIGFSIVLIGVLEGVAEAIAGLSKGYFGRLSDSMGRRLPFVQLGYLFSAVAKPMMALFLHPLWIFFARTSDRLGKGIRTGARDAILSDEAGKANKGRVFGFHRAMDTLGAVLGPTIALVYLYYYPESYRTIFLFAIIPGIFSVALTFLIREKKGMLHPTGKRVSFLSFFSYWKESPPTYRKIVGGLLVFALANSSDIFLLLKMKETGASDTTLIGIYIFYNLVYALFSYPLGILADQIGLKRMLIIGLVVFSAVYFLVGTGNSVEIYIAVFLLYGIYAAATEGIAKALISNVTERRDTASAIGTFSGLQSICAMIASSLAGFIWLQFGMAVTFILSGTAALLVAIYFLLAVPIPVDK